MAGSTISRFLASFRVGTTTLTSGYGVRFRRIRDVGATDTGTGRAGDTVLTHPPRGSALPVNDGVACGLRTFGS